MENSSRLPLVSGSTFNKTIPYGWFKENWFWVLTYILVFVYFVSKLFKVFSLPSGDISASDVLIPTCAILLAVVFVHIFSNPIPLPPEEGLGEKEKLAILENNREYMRLQRRDWMIFAFSFMILSMSVPIYMLSWGWDGTTQELSAKPIAVFIGCSLDDGKKELSCFSGEQKTDTLKPSADAPKPPADAPKPPADAPKPPADAPKPPADTLKPAAKSAWVLNLGGHVTNVWSCNADGSETVCQVRGGLLVPLYFVILALMGGSISLTRRLPEYQKRADPEYVSTEKVGKLSQHEFREYLVFQIVQFISAPLIAVLAYYLVEPSNTQVSVVLAFTAGFASESILLMIRSVAEKITPTGASALPQFGTITGGVMIESTASGSQTKQIAPGKNVEVSLVASPQIRTVTDESGFYILNNVPIGGHGIKVTPEPAAGISSITGSVKIERAQEVVKQNWMLKKP